jgi:hypothetical protein
MRSNIPMGSVPMWVWAVAAVLVAAQLTVEIWALVDMLRRPADQLTLGGRKWAWAIIILAVNWVGAILYFVVGRKPAAAVETAANAPATERAAAAADVLYGDPKGGQRT